VAIRYQNSLTSSITCVQYSHAAKRLLPGLPVTNEKLSSNSLSKNSQTQQKVAKYLEMAESLQKHYLFHWTSVVQRSFILRFVFYQNVYRFSTF